jgi:hypothetical protein
MAADANWEIASTLTSLTSAATNNRNLLDGSEVEVGHFNSGI